VRAGEGLGQRLLRGGPNGARDGAEYD
jgi:hypothetical protein